MTAAEAREAVSAYSRDDLIELVHRLAYRMIYASRMLSGKPVPDSCADFLYATLSEEAWIEAAETEI